MPNSLPFRSRLALAVLLSAALLTGSVPLQNSRVRALGEMLTCQCGCNYSIASCTMQGCHFADPARARLLEMVEAGMTDEQILAAFERQYGKAILRQPPAEGFYLISWIMPFAGLLAGLALLWLILRRYLGRRPAPASASAAAAESPELARYRERIEKDMADMDRDTK
jgi:cytochrome c-type biogenesis protein CcmH